MEATEMRTSSERAIKELQMKLLTLEQSHTGPFLLTVSISHPSPSLHRAFEREVGVGILSETTRG
jgi:hypothetical protein